MSEAELPDQEPGALHPMAAPAMLGHLEAETALALALEQGRVHHAWLLHGPRGVGKATLTYRFASALLGAHRSGPRPLDAPAEDGVARRVRLGIHPDLLRLTRALGDRGKLRREIVVDDVRALQRFLTLHPLEGGRRVVVIDCVDELNRSAANALLKLLEEPPAGAVLLLICHALGSILPTLRSRCRRLSLQRLSDADTAHIVSSQTGAPPEPTVLALAQGRPGRAFQLLQGGASELLGACEAAVREAAQGSPLAFAGLMSSQPERLARVLDLVQHLLREAAAPTAGAAAPAWIRERPPEVWAEAWIELARLREQAHTYNFDPAHALTRIGAALDPNARRRHALA